VPIYEFHCAPCHTIFSFLSRRVNTAAVPACPKCGQPLRRQVSAFAAPRGGQTEGAADAEGPAGADDARAEQAMAALGSEIEGLGEDPDPAEAAGLMRRFASASGMKFNATVEEALSRMAAGEDPEAVEAQFGDALEAGNPFADDADAAAKTAKLRRLLRAAGPRRDPTLYELTARTGPG
jgi:putative FmdB family regulatory protein